jgi:hypothetical protein
MKRNRIKEFCGAKYIANLGTKELHEIAKLTPKCRIEMITRGRYVWNAKKWEKKGFNGCRWCMPKKDRG